MGALRVLPHEGAVVVESDYIFYVIRHFGAYEELVQVQLVDACRYSKGPIVLVDPELLPTELQYQVARLQQASKAPWLLYARQPQYLISALQAPVELCAQVE